MKKTIVNSILTRAVMLLLALVTVATAWAQTTTDLSPLGSSYTAQDGEILTGTTSYRVTIPAGASITLNGATIGGSIVCEGTATITLVGTNSVSGGWQMAGIQAGGTGTMLTIQGEGSLTATGSEEGAGIGTGSGNKTCGDIIISGGDVTATGGKRGAGIGTGFKNCTCGDIIITGGVVTATGANSAAGIGAGYYACNCGNIIITGGVVTATGGQYAAGIGTGVNNCACGDITITEDVSRVTATKGESSPNSIGVGMSSTTCGTVTVGNATGSISQSPYTYVPVRNFVFVDGTAYTRTKDYAANSAIYRKTIDSDRVGKYQTWFMPFDYTLATWDLETFTFYKINMIANSPSPSVEASGEMWVFLTKLSADDVLHANMPYVYKPKEEVTYYPFTSNNVTLKAMNTGVVLKTETAEDIYSFYGTYNNTTATTGDPFYYVGIDGNLSLGNNGSVTVGPYRWILRKTSKYGGTSSYSPKVRFFDPEEDDVTGVASVVNENDNENVYDLSGRRINGQWSMVNGQLPKGIYIVNGRKVFIK